MGTWHSNFVWSLRREFRKKSKLDLFEGWRRRLPEKHNTNSHGRLLRLRKQVSDFSSSIFQLICAKSTNLRAVSRERCQKCAVANIVICVKLIWISHCWNYSRVQVSQEPRLFDIRKKWFFFAVTGVAHENWIHRTCHKNTSLCRRKLLDPNFRFELGSQRLCEIPKSEPNQPNRYLSKQNLILVSNIFFFL